MNRKFLSYFILYFVIVFGCGCIASVDSVQKNSDIAKENALKLGQVLDLIKKNHPEDKKINLTIDEMNIIIDRAVENQIDNKKLVTKEGALKIAKAIIPVAGKVAGSVLGAGPIVDLLVGGGVSIISAIGAKRGVASMMQNRKRRDQALLRTDPKEADNLRDI